LEIHLKIHIAIPSANSIKLGFAVKEIHRPQHRSYLAVAVASISEAAVNSRARASHAVAAITFSRCVVRALPLYAHVFGQAHGCVMLRPCAIR
jgi:hypothetical protein